MDSHYEPKHQPDSNTPIEVNSKQLWSIWYVDGSGDWKKWGVVFTEYMPAYEQAGRMSDIYRNVSIVSNTTHIEVVAHWGQPVELETK